jgi:acetyltransferase-like isoleucine patch superfamily enzyme
MKVIHPEINRFKNWEIPKMEHGKPTEYGWIVHHPQNLSLGKYSDIGAFTYLNALYEIEIAEYAQFGSHCSIYSYSSIDEKKGKVCIGYNARIGSHTTIMPGISIGENSIIGANSFVTKDVPKNSFYAGVPAKLIKELSDE